MPDAEISLVCFPHAGGSASFYFPLAAAMPAPIEVFAVQYPGRQDRRTDEPIEDIPELADRIYEALQPLAERRLALFGHSMGAILAYEVARRLERNPATRLDMLFASGRRAPSRRREETVHLRDDDGIIAEIGRLNGTDPRLLADPELRSMILPAVRSDYRAIENYRDISGAPVRCPITVLVGAADPHTTLAEAGAWAEHTTGGCAVQVFPGGHFFLTAAVPELAGAVSRGLLPATALAAPTRTAAPAATAASAGPAAQR
jgi:surfactin synthase thioesterase subunit